MLDALPDFYLRLAQDSPLSCGAWITACGLNTPSSSGYRHDGHQPQAAGRSILQYTLAGKGILNYRRQRFELRPGQLMLLQPPEDYVYQARDGQPWRFFFVTLNGPDAARYWNVALQHWGPVVDLDHSGPFMSTAIKILQQRFAAQEPSESWQDVQDAYALCVNLMREVNAEHTSELHPDKIAIHRVTDYIQRHLGDTCDITKLAGIADMSRAHFSRIFHRHVGHSPGAYVLDQRLEWARQLLRTSQRGIAEIALLCGFTDANYFSRIFARRSGVTPKAFRRRTLQEVAEAAVLPRPNQ